MERVVDSYKEYGGKYSGCTFHEVRSKALIFQGNELAQVLKALRRGSAKDKKLARKAFNLLTGFDRCPQCGKLTSSGHVYDGTGNNWCCEKCHLANRLKIGWSISKSEALHYFTREEYENLSLQAPLDKSTKLLSYADDIYGEYRVDEDYPLTDDIAACI